VTLGIVFSVLASACFSLSNLLEKVAVDRMPAISPGRAVHMFHMLRSSNLWLAGFIAGVVAVVLMTIGYSLTPIAIVQSIFGAGLVILVVVPRVVLHESIAGKEWVGLGVILLAVLLVSISLGSQNAPGLDGSLTTVVIASSATVVGAVAVFFVLRSSSADHSISFGVTGGLLYGVAALQAKSSSVILAQHGYIHGIPRILATPYPYVFLVTSLLGLSVFQTGLQRCRIAVVAPLTNIVASVYVVAIGMVVFDERLPKSPALSALRLAGFALVLVGSWFFSTGPASAGVEPVGSDRAGSAGRN